MRIDSFETKHAEYTIIKAKHHHIPLLNDIELAAATNFPKNSLPEHVVSEKMPIDILLTAKEQGMLWVAVYTDESPVGYVLLQIIDSIALLAQIDVHPGHGQKGVGTALMIHGIEQIQQHGFSELYLTTFSDMAWNAPFYKKLGFTILKESELPNHILSILHEERDRGLKNRVAMRLIISQTTRCIYSNYYKLYADKHIKRNTPEECGKLQKKYWHE